MNVLTNKYAQLLIAFIIGVICCYFVLPSKVVTKEISSETDKKTISELKIQLATATQIHSVSVTSGGSTVVTTDTHIIQSNQTSSTTSSHDQAQTQTHEKTVINPKWNSIEVGAQTDKAIYGHYQSGIFNPVVLGVHVAYSRETQHVVAGLGIGINF